MTEEKFPAFLVAVAFLGLGWFLLKLWALAFSALELWQARIDAATAQAEAAAEKARRGSLR